jgi:hypothetical protein
LQELLVGRKRRPTETISLDKLRAETESSREDREDDSDDDDDDGIDDGDVGDKRHRR